MAALPIFGQTRFVRFLATGSVVVVVGVVVVVVDPVGIVVVVVVVVVAVDVVVVVAKSEGVRFAAPAFPNALAGNEASKGLTIRPATTSAGIDAHDFHLGATGFTNSIYCVPSEALGRPLRQRASIRATMRLELFRVNVNSVGEKGPTMGAMLCSSGNSGSGNAVRSWCRSGCGKASYSRLLHQARRPVAG